MADNACTAPAAGTANALTGRPEWPAWIERKRIDDALSAEAYEKAGPTCRAAIKTATAMFMRYDAPAREVVHEERSDPSSGFWRSRTVFPAPWAVVAFTPDYTAAARLLGAVMPAIITGVPLIAAVCVGGIPSEPLLTALDLAGIEDIFSLSDVELSALLEETQPGPGRLVLLHTGRLDTLRLPARNGALPQLPSRVPSFSILKSCASPKATHPWTRLLKAPRPMLPMYSTPLPKPSAGTASPAPAPSFRWAWRPWP